MIMNPKIGDYIWFICRWTDLPVLGQVTSLKIDPANKNFPYERPYAEVDWYNGENPSEPGPWCGSTSVLLKDLYKQNRNCLIPLNSPQLDNNMPAENAGIFF